MPLTAKTTQTDIIIAGGGLSGTLAAAFIKRRHPHLKITIISAAEDPISQTWSFHANDISEDARSYLQPLLSKSWSGYSVFFPDHERRLDLTYCTIRSCDYWQKIDVYLHGVRWIEQRVTRIDATEVELDDGAVMSASAVIDARGLPHDRFASVCGWQKFLGFEIETSVPHGIREPIVMDARVKQTDGYRFFYVLPYSETSLLVEDTRYSDTPFINVDQVKLDIKEYLRDSGVKDFVVSGEEAGALPIPLSQKYLAGARKNPSIGMAGGFFHPTTGYSFPFAVQCAEQLAHNLGRSVEQADLNAVLLQCSNELRPSFSFFIRLNRMLFRAGSPEDRWRILSKFYRNRASIVSNFYSGKLKLTSKIAMLTGKPPVPMISGLRHFMTGWTPSSQAYDRITHG